MLVLTRKQMQSLCINDNIVVTVLKVRGNQVRLGLDVPKDLPIRRQPARKPACAAALLAQDPPLVAASEVDLP
jgi:carbon storage regulator